MNGSTQVFLTFSYVPRILRAIAVDCDIGKDAQAAISTVKPASNTSSILPPSSLTQNDQKYSGVALNPSKPQAVP